MGKDWTFALVIGVVASVLLGIGAAMGETSALVPMIIFVVTYGLTYVAINGLSAKL